MKNSVHNLIREIRNLLDENVEQTLPPFTIIVDRLVSGDNCTAMKNVLVLSVAMILPPM